MTVTAYWQNAGAALPLQNLTPTVVVRLRLPSTGTFVIWGRVAVATTAGGPSSQTVIVSMTTLDGATALDSFSFNIGAYPLSTCVPLQSTLDLSQPDTNEIVDIRCAMTNGSAYNASLIAIPVDALSEAAVPPPPS